MLRTLGCDFGGKRIAMRNSTGTIYYYEEDMLGSSRTMVQAGQTSVCFDADFLPFGYEKDVTSSCTTAYKFEGKERDTETSNDDFGARYYSNRFGRWLSPDWSAVPAPVPYANLTNPQTLNIYAMVSDNPESFADLDGHDAASCGTDSCAADPSKLDPTCTRLGDPSGACELEAAGEFFSEKTTGANANTNAPSDPVFQEYLQMVADGQSAQQQNAIIGRIMSFDADVQTATDADLARGSSSNATIDSILHNSGLRENGQVPGQVYLAEEDNHKKQLKNEIDAYVAGTSSTQELSQFLGRLGRVQYLYDKQNAGLTLAAHTARWVASRNPVSAVFWSVMQAVTPTPAKQRLLSYGTAAVNKRLHALGAQP